MRFGSATKCVETVFSGVTCEPSSQASPSRRMTKLSVDLRFAGAHALDFPALQREPGFEPVFDEIVEARLLVLCDRARRALFFLGHACAMILESPPKKHAGRRKRKSLADSEAQRARSLHDGADVRSRQRHRALSGILALVPRRSRSISRKATRSKRRSTSACSGFIRASGRAIRCQRPERIGIDLVSGPFRRLRGEWRFAPAAGGGTDISLTLTFEVTLSPFGVVFAKIFEELAASQMTAFVERAKKLYGAGT